MGLQESLARVALGARDAIERRGVDTPPDALAIIKDDHERVLALFESALRDGGPSLSKTRATVERIIVELERHAKMEETIFYPALRARTKASDEDRQTVLEAIEEHGAVKDLIRKIKRSTGRDETLRAKVQVLSELVAHHVREEESEMFGEARRLLGEKGLAELGAAMAAFKAKAIKSRSAEPRTTTARRRVPAPKAGSSTSAKKRTAR